VIDVEAAACDIICDFKRDMITTASLCDGLVFFVGGQG